MSTYLIGDVHGCYDELKNILSQVQFNPKADTLWLTGDLVAGGPSSLEVLRFIRSLGDKARIVLGNHDLHLLAVYTHVSRNNLKDRITPLLKAPDAYELINWLRNQLILQVDEEKKILMVHAGITPQWDIETAKQCAKEIELRLKSDSYPLFLKAMYGSNISTNWDPKLSGIARLRFSVNVFTRMRYCFPNGQLEMNCKYTPEQAPKPLRPWFDLPRLVVSKRYSIIFGHWASLMGKGTPEHVYGLDTGCRWGGQLTMLRWEDKTFTHIPSNHK